MSSKKPTSPKFLASTLSLSANRMNKEELTEGLTFCKRIIDSLSSCVKKRSYYEEWRGREMLILSYIFFIRHELKGRFNITDSITTYVINEDNLLDDID